MVGFTTVQFIEYGGEKYSSVQELVQKLVREKARELLEKTLPKTGLRNYEDDVRRRFLEDWLATNPDMVLELSDLIRNARSRVQVDLWNALLKNFE